LIRFDFGEVYLTDSLSSLTPGRATILSFIYALTFSPQLVVKILQSVLSGYNSCQRELILDEIKKAEELGHDFILVDDEKSFKESELLDVVCLTPIHVEIINKVVSFIDGDIRQIH